MTDPRKPHELPYVPDETERQFPEYPFEDGTCGDLNGEEYESENE